MDHRVDLRHFARVQIVPGEGPRDARLLRCHDVETIYGVVLVLREVSDKVGTHEAVDSGDEDFHGKLCES